MKHLTVTKNKETLPWIERYRPYGLDEVVGHQDSVETIRNCIKSNSVPHWLFYGPPGTGKTSLILAIARELHGDRYRHYVKEINASNERGIGTVREDVINFAKTRSDGLKLIIMDESDSMTGDAQSALRSTIEKYSANNRFCLICNNINRIIEPLQSRCAKIRFNMLDKKAIADRVFHVVKQEKVNITDEAVTALVDSLPDMRQIINTLQSIHSLYMTTGEQITKTHIYRTLGKPSVEDINKIKDTLLTAEFDPTYTMLNNMFKSNRWNLLDMIQHLCRKLLKEKLPASQKHFILSGLSEIEYRVKTSCDSEIQLAYLVSTFIMSREK